MANNNNQRKTPKFNIFWMYGLIVLFLLSALWFNQEEGPVSKIPWTKFENIVMKGGVKSITVYSNKNMAEAVMTDSLAKAIASELPAEESVPMLEKKTLVTRVASQIPSADKFEDNVKEWREKGVFTGEVEYVESGNDFSMILYTFGPIILLVALYYFLFRRK